MRRARRGDKLCRHGCHFSSRITCKRRKDDGCVCDTCEGKCQDPEDEDDPEGDRNGCPDCCDELKECNGCPCCGYIHKKSVLFPDDEACDNFAEDRDECRHCLAVLDNHPELPAETTVVSSGLMCEYHYKMESYNKSERLRMNVECDEDESGGASSSKRPRGLGGAAGGSSAVASTLLDPSPPAAGESSAVAVTLLDPPPPVEDPPVDRASEKSAGPIVISSDEEEEGGPAVPVKRARKKSPIVISTDEEEGVGSQEKGTASDEEQVVAPARIRGVSSFKLSIRRS